jgi:ankyrin repeat protein
MNYKSLVKSVKCNKYSELKNLKINNMNLDVRCRAVVDNYDYFLNNSDKNPTLLHYSIIHRLHESFKFLVEHNASLYLEYEGWNPLELSIKVVNKPAFRFLISRKNNLDRIDKRGISPLMRSCEYGEIEFVSALLQNGANVNLVSPYRRTALFFAIKLRHYEIAKLLLANGANPLIVNKNGVNAIEMSKSSDDQKIRTLFEKQN